MSVSGYQLSKIEQISVSWSVNLDLAPPLLSKNWCYEVFDVFNKPEKALNKSEGVLRKSWNALTWRQCVDEKSKTCLENAWIPLKSVSESVTLTTWIFIRKNNDVCLSRKVSTSTSLRFESMRGVPKNLESVRVCCRKCKSSPKELYTSPKKS